MALSTVRFAASRLVSSHHATAPFRRAPSCLAAASPASRTVTRSNVGPLSSTFRNISDDTSKTTPLQIINKTPSNKQMTTQASTSVKEEAIESAVRNNNKEWFEVTWRDGFTGRYPYVWLRDNCRCNDCYLPSCHSRFMLMAKLDPEIKPTKEELKDDGKILEVVWTDNHTSAIPADWLKLHRFDQTDFDPIRKLKKVSWGSEFADKIPSFKYEDVIDVNKSFYEWMENLITYGLVIITGAPEEKGIIRKICDRVGFPRMTCYGPDFRVENVFDSSSVAFTTAEIGLHVDLPFYDHRPGLQLLHCIRQCPVKGGESQFVDAKRIAEQMLREEPELFKTMTQVDLDFRLIGKDFVDFHLQQARPLIELDEDGEFRTLAYNDQTRSPYLNIPVEQVSQVYRALKKFNQALYREDNFIDIKLKEGEVVAFDNNRVLHGRSGYTVNMEDGEAKSRLLEGGFMDWDEIYSCMRLISEKMHGTPRL